MRDVSCCSRRRVGIATLSTLRLTLLLTGCEREPPSMIVEDTDWEAFLYFT